jgi:hypothetical protein
MTVMFWAMCTTCCSDLLVEEWVGTRAEAQAKAEELALLFGCGVNYQAQFGDDARGRADADGCCDQCLDRKAGVS